MSKIQTVVLFTVAILTAAIAGGTVGGGAAIALIRTAYNGPVQASVLPEVVVNSEELGEPITLRVHLPPEYDARPGATFPVLWVLDGPSQSGHIFQTTQILGRAGMAEPWIVVEVPSSSRGRRADFTPPWDGVPDDSQAHGFFEFLRSEAGPAVHDAYRAGGDQLLIGHSLGGLFVLYALLQDPVHFDGYLAFSPSVWVGDEEILEDLESAISGGLSAPTSLFMSLGEGEGNEMQSGFRATRQLLDTWSASQLRWNAVITDYADHGSNPELSFPAALRWYTDTAQPPSEGS